MIQCIGTTEHSVMAVRRIIGRKTQVWESRKEGMVVMAGGV